MKGIIRIIILLVCLASWQGIRADNVVTITGGSGTPGAEIDVSISLTNTDAVSAMQLSIPLVDGVELVENSAQIGSRVSETHTATVGVKDGNINVLVFSSSMATMLGSNGEVVRFKVRLGKEPSTLALSSSKLILTDTDGNNVSGTVQNGTISIRTAKAEYSTREMDFGRQPILGTYTQRLSVTNVGNEPLTITAFTFSASDFTCKEPLPLTLQAGSSKSITIEYAPQERGEVSEELKVVCNSSSKLNTITLKAAPYAVNELHVEDASGVSDSEILVHLRVNNMDALSGFQFEIPIPEQLEYVPESFALTDRKADHQVTTSVVGGVLKAVCYSLSDKTFTGNDGDIATFKVRIVGRYGTKLSASNAIFTANIKGKDINVLSDKYDGYISVVSPVLSAASSVNLGNHPVTQAPSYTYTVRNQGAADLTISRIVFDNDVFAVEGISLPLTIGASKSQTFTVVYKNASVGAHSATMQLYSNDPDRRLLNVGITGSLYSPNYITLSASDVTTSSTADIAVTLSNNLPISGMQFDIQYPSDKYTLDASSFVFEDQMKNYTANVRSMTKDVARVFLYSLTNNSIAVDTAQVMTIKLQPIGEVNVGTYSVSISNLKLGSQNMDDVQSQSTASTSFEVRAESFKLTYMVEGEIYREYEMEYTSVITPEAIPTKEGYTFSGWSAIPGTMPKNNVVVEGTFTINTYKLSYVNEGKTMKIDEVLYGASVTPLEAPSKYGYVFMGWDGLPETMPAMDVVVTGYYHVAMPGDVDSDQMITMEDVNSVANMILDESQKKFDDDPADVNQDGAITVMDETLIIDKILSGNTDATIHSGFRLHDINGTLVTDPSLLTAGDRIVIYPYADYSDVASPSMLVANGIGVQLTSWKKGGRAISQDTNLSMAVWILEDASAVGKNCYYLRNESGGYWGFQERVSSKGLLTTTSAGKIPVEIVKDDNFGGLFFVEKYSGKGYGLNDLFAEQKCFNWWTDDFSLDCNSTYFIRKIK